MRLDDKKMSRVQFCAEADGYNQETWPQSIAWHIEHMSKLDAAFKEPLQKAAEALRQTKFE